MKASRDPNKAPNIYILAALLLLVSIGFLALWVRGNYTHKLFVKLGFERQETVQLEPTDGREKEAQNESAPTTAANPELPTGLRATSSTDGRSVTLTWNGAAGARGYYVDRQEGSGSLTPIGQNVTGTSYVDDTAQPGTAYSYRLRACGNGQYSDYSAIVTVTTSAPEEAACPIGEVSLNYKHVVDAWQRMLTGRGAEVVFLGDSITYRGSWELYFPDCAVCNLGVGSDGVEHCLYRTEMVDAVAPEKVFVMCGINNIGARNETEEIVSCYEKILAGFEEKGYKTYVQSVLPVRAPSICDNLRIRELNARLAEISEAHNAEYIDLYSHFATEDGSMDERFVISDGIHLNEEGYRLWCELIGEYVVSEDGDTEAAG